MKLIEILVKHLNRWPDGVGEIEMHDDGDLFFDGDRAYGYTLPKCTDGWRRGLGADFSNSVTKEQYAAALAASKEMLVNKPVAWDGQGLPPVGAECEYKDYSTSEWHAVTITYCSNQVVVFSSNHKTFKGEPVEISKDLVIDSPEFRPVRTKAQRKRKEAIDAIAELCRSSASNGHSAELIYAAIEAGSIQGVKLEAPDA